MPQKIPKVPKNPKPAVEPKSNVELKKDVQFCAACKADGENRQAVKYCLDCGQPICQVCVDSHRRIRQIRDHKLVDQSSEDAMKGAKSLSSCLACPKHQDKTVEFICKSHNVMCCITCATANHRNCRQVVEVASQAKAASIHSDTTGLITHLDAAKIHMEKIVKKHEKHNQNIQSQTEVVIPQQVQDMKKAVIETLDALEERVKAETGTLGLQEINRGKNEINKWNAMIKSVTDAIALLTAAQQNGSDVQVYVAMNNVQKELTVVDRAISKQGSQLSRSSFLFEQGKALQDKTIILNSVLKTLACDDEKPEHMNKHNKAKPAPAISTPVTSVGAGGGFSPDQENEVPDLSAAFMTAMEDYRISKRQNIGMGIVTGADLGNEPLSDQENQGDGLGTVRVSAAGLGSFPVHQNKGSSLANISTTSVAGPFSTTPSGFGLFPFRQKPGYHNAIMPKTSNPDPRVLANVSVYNKVYSLPHYPFHGLGKNPNRKVSR